MSKKVRDCLLTALFVTTALFVSAGSASAQDSGGGSSTGAAAITEMTTDLDTIKDDATPIAVAVTGLAVGALVIKRLLYA